MYIPTKEELEGLIKAFDGIKAEDDCVLKTRFGDVFVDTSAYKLANDNGKCVVVGRKGSGKTALLLGYANKHSRDCFLSTTFSSDELPFQTLYSYFLRDASDKYTSIKKHAGELHPSSPELIDFLHPTRLSCYAWRMAIIQTAVFFTAQKLISKKICRNKEDLHILNKAVKDIKKEIGPGGATQVLPFLFERLVYSYGKISSIIEGTLSVAGCEFAAVVAKISGRVSTELNSKPKSTIMDAEKVIKRLLSSGRQRFTLFTYDRFDDFYDENYRDVLQRDVNLEVGQLSRKQLLASVLEGLILATSEIKSMREFSWLHMLVTIPMDKFMELELRERARLESSHVFCLDWKPQELFDFVNKRMREVLGKKVPTDVTPWDYMFPNSIPHIIVDGVREHSFLYIFRHTLGKPREVSMYCVALFRRMLEGYNTDKVDQIIRETVDIVTREIIRTQFIPEFISEYPNLEVFLEKIQKTRLKQPVMSYSEFAELIPNGGLSSEITSCDDVAHRLYEMCVIGLREVIPLKSVAEHSVSQMNSHVTYKFYYNSNDVKIGNAQLGNIVIHPLFLEHLSFPPRTDYVINEQKWEMYACGNKN